MHANRTSIGTTQAKHRSQAPSAAVCLTSKHHGDFQICPDRLPQVCEVTIGLVSNPKQKPSKNHVFFSHCDREDPGDPETS